MFDLTVYVGKTQTLKKLLFFVSHGYWWWAAGTVHVTKILKLVEKFDKRYGLNLNANQRDYRKSKGLANAQLLVYPINGTDKFMWWLLATDGDGPVKELEALKDTRKKNERLHWLDELEVVKRTRKGHNKPMFTWRMTERQLEGFTVRIKKAAASQNEQHIEAVLKSLYFTPGFGKARSQVGMLVAYAKKCWRQNHSSPMPDSGLCLHYVRYTEQQVVPLSDVLNRIRIGKTCFPDFNTKLMRDIARGFRSID